MNKSPIVTNQNNHSHALKPIGFGLILIAFILSIFSQLAQAEKHLPYFEAEYKADILGFPVSAKRRYRPLSDNIAELYFSADSSLASLEERSQFSWQDETIKPIRFSHERKIFGQSRRETLSFDDKARQITSTNKGEARIIDNSEGALDRLSFQLQLQHDLLFNSITNKRYPIADKNKIKSYHFELVGEEIIDTALGKLNTLKVKVKRDNKKRTTTIWLAKDWHYLLVKLEQYKNDSKQFSIELRQAVISGKKVTSL